MLLTCVERPHFSRSVNKSLLPASSPQAAFSRGWETKQAHPNAQEAASCFIRGGGGGLCGVGAACLLPVGHGEEQEH